MIARRRPLAARGALASLLLVTGLAACGAPPAPAAPAASASAVAPVGSSAAPVAAPVDPPMPSLRTGAIAPVEAREPVVGQVVARHLGEAVETLAIEVRLPPSMEHGIDPIVVDVEGPRPAPYSFVAQAGSGDARRIWVRRPRSAAGTAIRGRLFSPHMTQDPGVVARFEAPAPAASVKSEASALTAFARELERALPSEVGGFGPFAIDRLRTRFAPEAGTGKRRTPGPARRPERVRAEGDLGRLMETTTGVASIQEALQSDRPLLLSAAREKATVPMAQLAPPKSAAHPWDALLAALPPSDAREPLAAVAPAEFWFVRAKDLGVVFRLTDELDRWATPAIDALDGRAEERGLSARYEAELGLGRTALARAFGPEVVGAIALVGSDPYVREGTDVTAIFQLKSRAAFEAALAGTLAAHGAKHGAVTTTTTRIADVDVRVSTTPDGAVRQHRAIVGDLAFVSNSPGALRVVLEAAAGKRARLSDEKDFRYLLARDGGVRADAFAFMGDRFVGEVVGPRQKVKEARRQIALAELQTPAFAALLHGWLFGASPASVDDLVKAGLLAKDELSHGRGGAIAWKPGEAPRSAHGTPAALTPLVDLPAVELATPSERDAYRRFAQGYESYWSQYVDPAALRVAVDGDGEGARLTADLRVMPLIEGTEYRRIADVVGGTRLEVPPLGGSGARMAIALGVSARLRRELSGGARMFGGRRDVDLDWLGDYALLGTLDRTPVAVAVHTLAGRELPERPMSDDERDARRSHDVLAEAARAPLYAAIGVRSPAAAAIAIAAARSMAEDALPGMLTWGEAGKHRGATIVRVAFDEGRRHREDGDDAKPTTPMVTIYYALTDGALVLALDEQAIRRVIDDYADGKAPRAARGDGAGTQHVVDLAMDRGGALSTVLGWLLEGEVLSAAHRSRASAEVLLRGAPDVTDPAAQRALALAYLGAAPLAPDGGTFAIAPDGVRDPVRGTAHAPTWPAVPVPGSPIEKLVGAVRSFRSELSVDREGGKRDAMQSLHARVTLGLSKP